MVDLGITGVSDATITGRGGFATVYRAREEGYDREVAIKVIDAPAVDDDTRRRFDRERRAMGRLSDHPAIITVLGGGVLADGRPYLVMEFVPGGNLAERIRNGGPLPPEAVAEWGAILAEALAVAHDDGVLHRDVKPANVLIGRFDQPLLTDFGIARLAGEASLTASGVLTGTPAYLAPELVSGQPMSPASDQYGLAATLYAAAAGRAPYVADTDEHLVAFLARIAREQPPPLAAAGVPAPLATAIERGMHPDPARRHADARALAAALRKVATGLATPPPRPAPEAPSPPPASDDATRSTPTPPPFPAPGDARATNHATPDADPTRTDTPTRPPPAAEPAWTDPPPPPAAEPTWTDTPTPPPAPVPPAARPDRRRWPIGVGLALLVIVVVGALVVAAGGGEGGGDEQADEAPDPTATTTSEVEDIGEEPPSGATDAPAVGTSPGGDVDVFPVPPASADDPLIQVVSGAFAAARSADADTSAVLEYLATPEFVVNWLDTGAGTVSANRSVPLDAYDGFDRRLAEITQSAEVVRFDASDQFPVSVGAGSFWNAAVDVVSGAAPVAEAFAAVESSFPSVDASRSCTDPSPGPGDGQVSITVPRTGLDPERLASAFAAFNETTDIEVSVEVLDFDEAWTGDIAVTFSPRRILDGAQDCAIVPLPQRALERAGAHFVPGHTTAVTLDGDVFAVPLTTDPKSLVWFSPTVFAEHGYEVPSDLPGLNALVDQMVTDGRTPLCVGLESGAATGWVFTDWVEDRVLRTSGPAAYDEWATHAVPFDHPDVVAAAETVIDLWSQDGYVLGGIDAVLSIPFGEAGHGVVDGSCMLHQQAGFYRDLWPEGTQVGA